MHPLAKFQVCSFTRFGDMFEGMPILQGSRDPGHAHFLHFYFSVFEKLITCTHTPNLKSVALRVLEICLRECQIL